MFTSVTCRLLRLKIRFVKDRYFRIVFWKHAFNNVALYPLHHIENYLFLKKLWDESFACNCLQIVLNVSS